MYIKERRKQNILGSHKTNILEFTMLLCIFLGAMNFINRYYFCIYIGFIIFLMTPGRKITVNSAFVYLMMLSASILIFDPDSVVNVTAAIKPFTFPVCYVMGMNFLNNNDGYDKHHRTTSMIVFLLAAGSLVHYALNMYSNQGAIERNTVDYWTNAVMSATGQASIVCITIGVIAGYLFSDVNKVKKVFAIVALAIILVYNMTLASRTTFIFMLITFGVALIHKMIVEKKRSVRTVITVAIVAAVLIVVYNSNALGIKSAVEDSVFYNRFFGDLSTLEVDEDSRLDAKLYYLANMLDHPFGGYYLRKGYHGSAHDLYLDTYDQAGIFSLIGVGFYIITAIKRVIKYIKCTEVPFAQKQLILSVYVVSLMQFMTEPILRGMPWLFASFCIIDGLVTAFLDKVESQNTEKSPKAKYYGTLRGYKI